MTSRASRLLVIGASVIAMSDTALAERVKWRVEGAVIRVGPSASALPFAVAVGQPFIIEMEFENDSPAATGGFPGSDTATYNNVLKATAFAGGNEILITPGAPGITAVWNDHAGLLPWLDRYVMELTDAATDWQVRWQVVAPRAVVSPPGPLDSLALLQTPPNPAAFAVREMYFRQYGDGPEAASITASLDSITAVASSSDPGTPGGPNPGAGADTNGGGGRVDAVLLAILGMIALLRGALRRPPGRGRRAGLVV